MFDAASVDPELEDAFDWMAIERDLRQDIEDRTWANTRPSGLAALEIDTDTEHEAGLSDAQLIDAIVGFERFAAWAEARQARLLAEFARRRPGDDPCLVAADTSCTMGGFAPDEVGLALKLARLTAKGRLGRSVQLEQVLPETLQLWEEGRLDERRVTAICEATLHLPADKARAVQLRVLDRAPDQTVGQLKAALRRAVIAIDPEGAAERHKVARRGRRVAVSEEQDGMASLWMLMTASDAQAGYQWLTRLALGCGKDDPRGMDARRADIAAALLSGRLTFTAPTDSGAEPGEGGSAPRPVNPGKPLVQVQMPFSTLIGADDQPCELVGHGSIPADLAREIAADAVWKRLIYDPLSGTVLDYGRTTYRPPAGLADHVRARDGYCRGPICRRRALDSHLDHVTPYPEGPTNEQNLHACCGHDHRVKHAPGWEVRALPDGRIQWITPTGHRYHSEPHDHRPDEGDDLPPDKAPRRRGLPKDLLARLERIARDRRSAARWNDGPEPPDGPAPPADDEEPPPF
ncbi:HNH endonuclease signature motif containing protein [Pseudonocardia zijingensis]|jgi:hypothetical protein|uniref:HNH endonuclease signature motif containing protein n=1 Tax=Pseudonocardia zijingensis TaxID=153376 RepID=A0ABN1PFN5_9PSEU